MGQTTNLDEEMSDMDNMILALQMRKTGRASYAAIGKAIGCSRQSAYLKVKRALRMFQKQATDEYRESELERMDAVIAILWPEVIAGKGPSIDRYIKASQHRAELAGAYAPKQVQAINVNLDFGKLTTEQLERLARGEDLYSILSDLQSAGIVDAEVVLPTLPEPQKEEEHADTTGTVISASPSGDRASEEKSVGGDSIVPTVPV